MQFSERIEQFFKEFMYEKGRAKNNKVSGGKPKVFDNLLEVLDEMEAYIDEKTKEYQKAKKK